VTQTIISMTSLWLYVPFDLLAYMNKTSITLKHIIFRISKSLSQLTFSLECCMYCQFQLAGIEYKPLAKHICNICRHVGRSDGKERMSNKGRFLIYKSRYCKILSNLSILELLVKLLHFFETFYQKEIYSSAEVGGNV
jgi:hypothetical protein